MRRFVLRLFFFVGQGALFLLFLTPCSLDYHDSMYNNLVSRCFEGCVSSFRSKNLDKGEIGCVDNCANRYIKMTQRVGLRFAEHQALEAKKLENAVGSA